MLLLDCAISGETVNFSELATAFSGKAQTDSHYKRLQRFFRDYEMDYAEIAQAIITLMAIPELWVLSIDPNHTITRAAVDWAVERKVGKIYVGDLDRLPKGRKKGSHRIKQVYRNNIWEMPTQAKYLEEKMQLAGGIGTEKASEAFTSQVCPQCGRRHKPRNRIYYCNPKHGGCGWRGDRDGVGSANFLSSVVYGTCGKLMPVLNRTLRIAPAIRQGLLMPEPDSQLQVTTVCEPAEDAAKGSPDSSGQGLTVVLMPPIPRTARNPRISRRTQASGGMGMLVNLEIPDTARLGDTCSELATRKTGDSSRGWNQLSLWEMPCNELED